MKKQYLFSCMLLLSTFCVHNSRTMQEQHNEAIHQNQAQIGQCYMCNENIENPRRLTCDHEFCNPCITQWAMLFSNANGIQCPRCRNIVDLGPSQEETEIFNQVVVGSLDNQQAQPAQPVQLIQPEVVPQVQPLPPVNIQANQPLPQEQARLAERFLRQVNERRALIVGAALVTTGTLAYKFRKSLVNVYTRTKTNICNAYRRFVD